ncbi:hypothetical protein SETIT_4G205000v2 [Setaria italica]|uniref:Uncharacterized protein n=1 Tax=Setaria italica TaxID=4555 RepID=A0A368QWC9_SETIT|nr:hypothetical protein SETIT_4G205000v2 [Setaria italica]RCV22240.1 hypothetical protein SETIT_4G205000v2 [Setaria italica]RCV22241.1 hypothetical protein SETIT_4G205000v2 [Setaria italica]
MACPGSMGKETRIEAGGDEAAGRQGSSEDRTRTTPQGQQQGDLNSSPEMAKIQKLGVTMHAPAPCRSQYCGFYSGCLDSALQLGTARTFETTVLRLVDFRPRQGYGRDQINSCSDELVTVLLVRSVSVAVSDTEF